MGNLDCTWTAAEMKLSCPLDSARTPGDWIFTLTGDTLSGTLTTRADHRLIRKVTVRRQR